MNITIKEIPCYSREMSCQNRTTIFGLLYTPVEYDGKLPAVILSHGYNSSHRELLDMAECLAKNGFAAYCYDFCGGSAVSKSGGSSLDMSIETEISDLKAVIKTISETDHIDTDRIYLYGESQGGFVSALTAAQIPDKIAGEVLLYPAFCIPDNWLKIDPETMKEPIYFMGMKLSRTYRDGVPDYDVFEAAGRFHRPVLIHHGDSDGVVDLSYAERLHKAIPQSKMFVYHGEGHGFAPDARKLMCERTAEFLAQLAFGKSSL
ncbi:MAG: alpha/beta fold hydrolase [Oscillospiraceae bacterium]|nr:alpha/beta fold hydrolase [Oscillospiraceae bacterium]